MRFDPYSKVQKICDTSWKRRIIAGILIAIGIALPFQLIPFEDFRFGDEPYQAYCCQHYAKAYLGMLSFWIGNLWMRLFGEYYIGLRALMTLSYVSSIAIGCIYVKHRGMPLLQTAAVFLMGSLGIILNNIAVYGWDAASYPFVALCVYSTLLYLENPKTQTAAIIGAEISLMFLCRIPLILGVGIGLAAIIYKRSQSDNTRAMAVDCAAMLGAMTITFAIMTSTMVGSPMQYFRAITSENTVGGHSFGNIQEIWEMCKQFAFTTSCFMLPGCVAVALGYYFARQKKNSLGILLLGVLTLIIVTQCAFANMPHPRDLLFWCNFGIIVPSSFFALTIGPASHLRNSQPLKPNIIYIIVILAFAFLQAAGSDRIIERIGWSLAIIFAIGANRDIFIHDKKLNFYFVGFTTLMLLLFYCLKLNALNKEWLGPAYPRYATVFQGIRPNKEELKPFAFLDSIKFLKENIETRGYRTIAIGPASNCFNFSIGENGENSGIKFYVELDDIKRDFNRANDKEPVDVVISLTAWHNTDMEEFLIKRNFKPYHRTDMSRMTVYVKDSIFNMLPANPFKDWGYQDIIYTTQ